MTKDPSTFMMIDGPLTPQGNVESEMVALAPIDAPAKIRILAALWARNILLKRRHLFRDWLSEDYTGLRDDIEDALLAAAHTNFEEI